MGGWQGQGPNASGRVAGVRLPTARRICRGKRYLQYQMMRALPGRVGKGTDGAPAVDGDESLLLQSGKTRLD